MVDSFQQDDSTRQSQDSNYSDEGGVSVSDLGGRQELLANDDSNMSFPPMSDSARQSVQDSDADPDMRLGQLHTAFYSLKTTLLLWQYDFGACFAFSACADLLLLTADVELCV